VVVAAILRVVLLVLLVQAVRVVAVLEARLSLALNFSQGFLQQQIQVPVVAVGGLDGAQVIKDAVEMVVLVLLF
jgi:hypothetical protein